ncbi:MAG TPA: hypothetical protein PLO37_24315 [Candidatus Hydrogenedentes bacterium]|nr:hypothetical protein [Candidatus Hydrogenedentota bacterium]HPG69989.1 hypothetical protein [Candidatus Hydrogenedentota bacterium]
MPKRNSENIVARCLKAMYAHGIGIVLVTVTVGALAVVKEIVFPPPFYADTLLVVTDLGAQGDAASIVPEPFNPKIYEQLVRSTALLGEVHERLLAANVFPPDKEPPALDDFMAMLRVSVTTVDQTTRPVTYSPLLRLSTSAKTAELATAIVDTWAQVAIERAGQAVSLRLLGSSESLERERVTHESVLEEVWKELEVEKSQWDLAVLRQEMETRVELLGVFYQDRATLERDLTQAQKRLATIQESLTAFIAEEETGYRTELDTLRAQLTEEQSLWNTKVLEDEVTARVELLNTLYQEQTVLERDLANARESLRVVQESLTQVVEAEEGAYKTELTGLWKLMVEERSEWNTAVLNKELDTRVELLTELYTERAKITRLLAEDQERLRTIQDGLTKFLSDEQLAYKAQLEQLAEALIEEESEWNTTVLTGELTTRLELLNSLYQEQQKLVRDLVNERERLRMIQETLMASVTDEGSSYREELDSLYARLMAEESQWNVTTMQKEIDTRVELLNAVYTEQSVVEGKLASNQERLKTVQERLAGLLASDEKAYSAELDDLTARLAQEMTEWNVEVITQQLNTQVKLLDTLAARKAENNQELAGVQAQLAAIAESLQSEQPLVELGRAPSDTEYWIVKGDASKKPTMSDLDKKVMVTQELNLVYWELKSEEAMVRGQIASLKAAVEAIGLEMAEASAKQKEIEAVLAEHQRVQDGLRLQIEQAQAKYSNVASVAVLKMKEEERTLFLDIAGNTATLNSIKDQIATIRADQKKLETQLAEHKSLQESLRLEISLSTEKYTNLATTEVLSLKEQERGMLLDIATKTVIAQQIYEQIDEVRTHVDDIQATLAEHQTNQDGLRLDIKVEEEKYSSVSAVEELRLKTQERDLLLNIAANTVSAESLDKEILKIQGEMDGLKATLAEHEAVQQELDTDINLASQRYTSVATNEVLALKDRERGLLMDIGKCQASMDSIRTQIDQVRLDEEALESQLAEHDALQEQLRVDVDINKTRYQRVAGEEVLAYKQQERMAMLDIAAKAAAIEALDRQMATAVAEQEEIEALIAEHQTRQTRLETREELARTVYKDVAKADALVAVAAGLARGKGEEEGVKAVGLNLLSDRTFAITDKGLLGRKGRVIVATFLAFCLSALAAIARDVGYPTLRDLLAGI